MITILLLLLVGCGQADSRGNVPTPTLEGISPQSGTATTVTALSTASPSGPQCNNAFYQFHLHYRGRSYGQARQVDLPAGGPIPWALSSVVGTTFLPWQTDGYFPADTSIYAVQGAQSGERLVVQGKDYAMLYCALPDADGAAGLGQTVVVLGTIEALLPNVCTATQRDARCPSGVGKIYAYQVAVSERLAGGLSESVRHLKVLHSTWQAAAIEPQPGMRVLLFLRSGASSMVNPVNPPTDPERDYWLADVDAAYLIEEDGVRWMDQPATIPRPSLAAVRQRVKDTFSGVRVEDPMRPRLTPTVVAHGSTPVWMPTPRPTINPTTHFRLAETRRIVLSGPRITMLKGGPEVIEDPVRIAAIVAGLDQPVLLGQEEAVRPTAWDFSARFERADGTITLFEYFEGNSIFLRNRFSDEHETVALRGVAGVLDIFGVFGGPRVR